MDKELDPGERERILAIARAVPRVLGVHDLRTRRSGHIRVIQLHLELDDELRLLADHRVCDAVEEALLAEFPEADITIHQDPRSLGAQG